MGEFIYIITACGSWMVAQAIKIGLSIKQKDLHWTDLIASGGMPSAHVSLVTSMLIVIGYVEGLTSAYFGISLTLWGVVLYDSMGVRRATGENIKTIQQISKHLKIGQPVSAYRLALGHSPLQSLMGIVTGIIWGSFVLWIV